MNDAPTPNALPRHPLGRTGLEVPPIVFGTSCLGNLYEALPWDEKLAIMRAWFEHVPKPVVIDTAESDLQTIDESRLRQLYPSIEFNYFSAEAWESDDPSQQGSSWQDRLLALAVILLLLEQALAFYASYHPATPGASAA